MALSRTVVGLAAIAAMLVPVRSAVAAWPTRGVVVAQPPLPFYAIAESRLLNAADGSVLALGAGTTASGEYWGSQRATPGGDLTPFWPGLIPNETTTTTGGPGVLAKIGLGFSTAGDVLVSWADGSSRIFHQRLTGYSDATPVAQNLAFTNPLGWGVYFTGLAPAPNNDVYIYYGGGFQVAAFPRLIRRTPAGTVSPGWPVNGKRLFTAFAADGMLLPDGAGGVIASERTTSGLFRVQRINADSTVAAGWGTGGLDLSFTVQQFDEQPFTQILPAGANAWLGCWLEQEPSTSPPTYGVSLQRFLGSGVIDPAWSPDGITLTFTSTTLPRINVLADGAGGAFVLYERDGEPRGAHVLASGVLDPAIAGDDAPLLDPAAQYVPERDCCAVPRRVPLVACAGKNGGLIFAWADGRTSPSGSLRARWLTSSLQPDPSEPAMPRAIPTRSANINNVRAATSDGFGGLYVAWEDTTQVLTMNRVLASEFLAAPPPAAAVRMTLSAPWPNPARDRVTMCLGLPDDSGARVELLDVAGRVARSQSVSGAGTHALELNGLDAIRPGLYFLRAAARAGTRTTRLIVVR